MTETADDDVEAPPVGHVVSMLRERLYGAISCLATLVVLTRYTEDDTSGWFRMLDVAVTMGGLWAASLLADWVAHLAVHEEAPHGAERWRMLQASGQILQASVLPWSRWRRRASGCSTPTPRCGWPSGSWSASWG